MKYTILITVTSKTSKKETRFHDYEEARKFFIKTLDDFDFPLEYDDNNGNISEQIDNLIVIGIVECHNAFVYFEFIEN